MNKTSMLVLATALAATPLMAADVQFGGDADFRYFNVRDTDARATGMDQRIRLQTMIDAGQGVSVHARLNLINDRWTGDASGSNPDENPFTADNRGHRTAQLDYGFVRMPLGPGTLTVGRQVSAWNHGLTALYDRRDRISYATRVAGQVLSLSYDHRTHADDTDRSTIGHQYNVAMLGAIGETGWNYGALITLFEAGGSNGVYPLRGTTLFSPYITGPMGPVDMTIGAHYLGNGRGAAFTEDSYGGFVRGGFQLRDSIRLEGQVFYETGGTLVAGGFDSFSSLIHNSPDHEVSRARIDGLNLGGNGSTATEDNNTLLVAARARFDLTNNVSLIPALGLVQYDRPDRDEDVVFVDLRAEYQVAPTATLFAAAGYADAEDYLGSNVSGASTGFQVQF